MENKVEILSLREYLKQGFKEIINRINGKKEENELSKMTDIVDEETIKILTDSLAERDAYAQEFQKQQLNEDKHKNTKQAVQRANKEMEQTPNYQVLPRKDKGREMEH